MIAENTMSTSPTLWVGTNSGLVLVLSLSIPHLLESRQRDGVTAGDEITQSSADCELCSGNQIIIFSFSQGDTAPAQGPGAGH